MDRTMEMARTTVRSRGRLPVLALVGRPNVGKSTLFNRLTHHRGAIVDNLPGVTRDRNYGAAEWYGRRFLVIDTGGFEPEADTSLKKQVQEQTRLAIEEADAILFLFDGKNGLHPLDRDAVDLLRKVAKPVFFAVNKLDTQAKENALYEFYALGLEEIFPLSAEHGLGLSEVMERVVAGFPAELKEAETETETEAETEEEEEEEKGEATPLALAVVGRPNVGKSTLVNCLLGFDRSVVDTEPGTTRDALDTRFTSGGEPYTLVDTAGIRRKARIADRVERYSVIRSLNSVERGDLVIYLMDGPEGVTSQDAQILAYAAQRGKGLILAVNKWDLMAPDSRDVRTYSEQVYRKLSFVDYAPVVFISAATGFGVPKVRAAIKSVAAGYQRRVSTSALNQAVRKIFARNPPPLAHGKPVKFFYATQLRARPPTFLLFVNFSKGIAASYERYLVHQMRRALGLESSPIRLILRGRREESKVKGKRQKIKVLRKKS